VPFRTATVILSGAAATAFFFVVVEPLFFAESEPDELSSFVPLTSAGTPIAAAAPSTRTPATARTT
jgi:hypothetical protein